MYDVDSAEVDPDHLAEGSVAVVENVDVLEKGKGIGSRPPTIAASAQGEETPDNFEESEKIRRQGLKAVFKRALYYSAALTFIVAILGE